MARRKRLTPIQMDPMQINAPRPLPDLPEDDVGAKAARPPIASVAGQSATEAAFQEVAGEMRRAREEGRLIQLIPLDAIAEDHLVRDRMGADDEDMAALVASIEARGQTTPIEVVKTGAGTYGLISGWRRLQALRQLCGAAEDARFAHVRALVIKPRDAGEAYVAMVEENEIRADLSHYERARIVARAVRAGAFPDPQTALRTLFANASRAKRSKIKSFMGIVEALDEVLRFPTHLGERLGLELAGRLNADAGFAEAVRAALTQAAPTSPEDEARALRRVLDQSGGAGSASVRQTDIPKDKPAAQEVAAGVFIDAASKPGRLVLTGPGVDAGFQRALAAWIKTR